MANQPKKYKKFVATAATATLVASAIVPVASAAEFKDVAGSDHATAINALSEAGIVNGYADGTFKPNQTINRGQVVKMLGRWLEAQGQEIPADWKTEQRFNDLAVTAEEELVQYAALAKDAGVFNGSNGNLNYTQNMQRQQMAVVLVRAIQEIYGVDLVAEYKEEGHVTEISDLDKAFSAEQRNAIVALEYAGITNVSNFRPADSVTRGQFASFLFRTIENVGNAETEASVKAINNTTVEVTFEEEVDDVKALDFAIEGLEITNAAVKQTNSKVVVLTTSAQTADVEYTVTLNDEEIGSFKGIAAVVPTGINVTTTSVQGVVGQQVSVKAEVKVAEGQSKAGIPVTFNVDPYDTNATKVSSLNKSQVVEVTTDENGVATYTYTQYNAGQDQVIAYATGNPASRSFAKVYWGVKPILTLTSKEGTTLDNGKAKTYTATYLDPVTGTPVKNQELKVTFKENIDDTVTNDTNAVATDVATGSVVKPFESKTDERVLTIRTNANGEATFTVTGSNTAVTPLVYVDSDALNTSGWNRLDSRDLQAVAETTKFGGSAYTFKFNKEVQFEAVATKAFTYEVQVLKADGTPYAGGTATVALNELIDSSLSTNTKAYIVNNSKVKPISGKAGVYTLSLDKDGKAKFDVKADQTEVSATPVVWVDVNTASNIQGTLESEESFKLAGSVVFRNEVIGGAKLTNTSDVTGLYGVSSTGLQQPVYSIKLLDQAEGDYSKNDYSINRVTYTISNTGNSSVELDLNATNFVIDTISNSSVVNVNDLVIAAGQSVTVTGHTTANPKNVALAISNANAGTLEVTGSVTTNVYSATTGTWSSHNSYYAAGTTTSQWVAATEAGTEVTGVVKGFQTVDTANNWGYALVLVDGSSTYQIVKYGQSNSFYAGTQTDFNRLTSTDANGFEKAISLEDRISLKNSEIRLINVDASNKDDQAKGNGAGVINTEITQAVVNAVNNAVNAGQVKTALKAVSAANALSDADQNTVADSVFNARGSQPLSLYDVASLTTELNNAIATVYSAKVSLVNAAITYADLITAVRNIPGAAASVTALEAITDTDVQNAILAATFTGGNATQFNDSVTSIIAAAKATANQSAVTAISRALTAVTTTTDTAGITAANKALNDNATKLGLNLTAFNALNAIQKAYAIVALGSYSDAAALQTAINDTVKQAVDTTAPTVTTITTSGDTVSITFSENVSVSGTVSLNYLVGTASGTATGTATFDGNKVTITLAAGHAFAAGVKVTSINGAIVDTALVPNDAKLTGLDILVTTTPAK